MSMGLPMGLAMASGLNTYLPLLAMALFARYSNFVQVSPKFQWLVSDQMLIVLILLVLAEVLADKFPGLDHVWDFIHTLLRPAAGAIAAGATVTTDNLFETAVVMVMGGSLASATHAAKATVRLASTSKTMGAANPILSIVEDVTSLIATLFAVFVPWVMAILAVLFVVFIVLAGPPLLRTMRYNFGTLAGVLAYTYRKIAGTPPPRDLSQSIHSIPAGELRHLKKQIRDGEDLQAVLAGWRRTGWGPRRIWLLMTASNLVLVERRFPGRTKTQSLDYSDLQLVRERRSLTAARLEIFTRQNQDLILLFPKTTAEFVRLAVREISCRSNLGQQVSTSAPASLAPATP